MLDSHCHIDQYKDPEHIVSQAAKRGVFIIAVTNLPSHFEIGLPHTRTMKNIRLALGMHPLAAREHESERERFRKALSLTSYVGEVGLDFSHEGISTQAIQLDTFRYVADCLRSMKRVVSLHSRKAESAVLDILAEYQVTPAIFHWYSGPLNLIDRAQERGHFFSINPAMIRSQNGKRIIDRISPDRILTESDGPHVRVGKSPAEPWHVNKVQEYLATLWQVPSSEVGNRIWSNFHRLLTESGVTLESSSATTAREAKIEGAGEIRLMLD